MWGGPPGCPGAVTAADALVGLRFERRAGPGGRSERGFGADEGVGPTAQSGVLTLSRPPPPISRS